MRLSQVLKWVIAFGAVTFSFGVSSLYAAGKCRDILGVQKSLLKEEELVEFLRKIPNSQRPLVRQVLEESKTASSIAKGLGKTHLMIRVDFSHLPYILKEGALLSGKVAKKKYGKKRVPDDLWGLTWEGEGIEPASSSADLGRFWFDVVFTTAIDKRYRQLKIQEPRTVLLYLDLKLLDRSDVRISPYWTGSSNLGVSFKKDPRLFLEYLYLHPENEVTFKKKISLKEHLRGIVVKKTNHRPSARDDSFVPYLEVLELLEQMRKNPPRGYGDWRDLLVESNSLFVDDLAEP